MNRHFPKDGTQMAKRDMKRCSTLLNIRKMEIRTAMRHPFTRDEWLPSRKQEITGAIKDVVKREAL